MKIRIMMTLIIVLLAACSKEEVTKQEQAQTEHKESAADIARKKIKESREKQSTSSTKNETVTEEPAVVSEAANERVESVEPVTTEAVQKDNVNNITNRSVLQKIIYSNDYTAAEKMAAYQSGVANGVIPQGTDTTSPAAAFESALRAEQTGATTPATQEQPTTPTVDPNTGLPVQQ